MPESKELYPLLFEFAPVGTAVSTLEGRVLHVNRAFCDLLGYSAAELVDCSIAGILHPDERAPYSTLEQEVLRNELTAFHLESRCLSKDSQILDVNLDVALVRNGEHQPLYFITQITESAGRKRSEHQLEDQVGLLHTLPEAVIVTDPDFAIRSWNRAAERLYGWQADEVMGQALQAILGMDYPPLSPQALWKQGEWQGETVQQAKDGRVIHTLTSISVMTDPQGRPSGVITLQHDINERKQAEIALQKQNRELALLNQATQAFISSLDLNQLLIKVLEEMRDLLEVTMGSAWLVDPVTSELVCWQATVQEQQMLRGWRLAPGQGIVGWVVDHRQSVVVSDTRLDPRHYQQVDQVLGVEIRSILSVPLFDQQEVFGVLEMVDTSVDRFKTSDLELIELLATTAAIAIENASLFAALLDSEKRYRNLFENATIALWEEDISALRHYLEELRQKGIRDFRTYFYQHPEVVDHCRELIRVINVNRAALEMYHATSKDTLLDQLNKVMFKAEPVEVFTEQLVAFAEGQTRFTSEVVLSTLSDNKIYTELSWLVVPTYNNLAQKAIVYLRDVTEQKRLQQQFLQAQKMEAVGQLAGGIAHNFNNMLTAIMGYLGLAIEALATDHPIVADLRQVQSTAKRAASLTQQLLIFSRRQPIDPKPLNLNELILAVKPLLRPLLHGNIQLITSLDPGLGLVKIDATQVEQVLMNLTVNARDAMLQGGKFIIKTANLTLNEPNPHLPVEVVPGDYILLSMTDTGIGMTEEIKSHLFEPFFTTKEIGKGTGLGLATCYSIIKQSKGHILVDTQPGQGTTFNILLPRYEPASIINEK